MSEWIKVEEKTPITSMRVLVRKKDGEYLAAKYGHFEFADMHGDYEDADEDGCVSRVGFYYEREDNGEYDWLIFDITEEITHWMPIPEISK